MKKILTVILTLFLILINSGAEAAQKVVSKEYKIPARDGFQLTAVLSYPNIKKQREFKTVVLLHSMGYNSEWWGDLPEQLHEMGYAVLYVDMRGHGKSVYNKNLGKVSWKSMTNKAYMKIPDDINEVLNYVKDENSKRVYFRDWAIVGSDLGAISGIMASDEFSEKPKTIVMFSPVVQTRGLYVPVHLAHLDGVDILSITGDGDVVSQEADKYLKKFAQGEYVTYTSAAKTTGMLLMKNDPELLRIITEWIGQYLK